MTGPQKPVENESPAEQLAISFALKAAQLGVWELDPTTNLVIWDDQCRALFGLAANNQLPYEEAIRYIHPDDTDRVNQAVQWAMNPELDGAYDVTYRTIGADDGVLRWVRFTGRSQFDETGVVSSFAGIAQDVTEQMMARRKVEESETRFRSLVEESPVATCLFVGRDLIIDVANELMVSFFGRGPAILGKSVREVLTAPGDESAIALLEQVFTTGTPFDATAAPSDLTIDGVPGTYYFDLSLKPLRNAAGDVYAVLETATNVTERITAQQRIDQKQQQVLRSFEQAPVAIAVLTHPNLTYLMANAHYCELVSHSSGQLLGRPLLDALPEANGQDFAELLEGVIATHESYEVREAAVIVHRQHGPDRLYFDFTYQPWQENGQTTGVMIVAIDVTQQVLARRAIEESEERYRTLSDNLEIQVQERTEELEAVNEELAAMNEELTTTNEEVTVTNDELIESNDLLARSNDNLQQFAYVASHDLQEPLRKIQQFGDLLKSQYADALGEGVGYLERMQSAASRMSTLIRDLLSFSRISTQRDTSAPVSLDEVVGAVLTDLDLIIAETGATVAVGPLPTLVGDASQLRQLFQNLLTNALKFRRTDVRPIVTVSRRLVAAAALPQTVHPTRTAAIYYRIDITDNGVGFDDKYVDRIFQVFQRLHGRNEFAGTGIGLAICEKVAANHGGAITATSRPGQGATFSVYLPR